LSIVSTLEEAFQLTLLQPEQVSLPAEFMFDNRSF
jgi:hypothetical protein